MKVSELALGDETGVLMKLESHSLWHQNIEQLDSQKLLAHYTIIKRSLGCSVAIQIMKELKGECMLKLMLGDMEYGAIIDFRPPVNDLVGQELIPFMQSLPFNARALILVALAEKNSIEGLINLQWSEVQLMPWTDFSRKVIARVPPRLGCDYVFWEENTLGSPTPLLILTDLIQKELGVSWSEFKKAASTLLQFEHFAHPHIESLLGITHQA